MVGIPHFRTQTHLDQLAQDAASVRKAKQEMSSSGPGDSNANPVVALQVQASVRMQGEFMGRLIRRKATSLDFEQKPLLNLPPCDVVDVTLQLQPWELEFVDNSIPDETIER
jgi:TATA-binding protein-associated factor